MYEPGLYKVIEKAGEGKVLAELITTSKAGIVELFDISHFVFRNKYYPPFVRVAEHSEAIFYAGDKKE